MTPSGASHCICVASWSADALSGCLPFSHAPIDALDVMTSGVSHCFRIASQSSKALSGPTPLSHALIDAL